jgi:alginate O-acetyltransferase, putative
MLFNSYEFIFLFLPITYIGFFTFARLAGKQAAISWIVAASFFFYGWWDVRYLPLLFGSICFNYIVGVCIQRYYDVV